jgi:hypothetical protein
LIPLRRSRPNRRDCLTLTEKDFQEDNGGDSVTCGRELLRGWWRPIGLMASFKIFTKSVRNILDTIS